jgi:hypothetical protein
MPYASEHCTAAQLVKIVLAKYRFGADGEDIAAAASIHKSNVGRTVEMVEAAAKEQIHLEYVGFSPLLSLGRIARRRSFFLCPSKTRCKRLQRSHLVIGQLEAKCRHHGLYRPGNL